VVVLVGVLDVVIGIGIAVFGFVDWKRAVQSFE
jgi:hypothetical protein